MSGSYTCRGTPTITGQFNTLGCCGTDAVFQSTQTTALPYLYKDGLCCVDGGTTPTIYDFMFQNCCGPDSYRDPTRFKESQSVTGANLFTYTKEFCCENPGQGPGGISVPQVGTYGEQGCCGQTPGTLGVGGTLFDIGSEICCGDEVFSSDETGCCNDVTFDVDTQDCCGTTIYTIADQGCCGSSVYDLDLEGCCVSSSTFTKFTLATQDCCNGVVYELDESLCCDQETCEDTLTVIDVEEGSGKKGAPECPAPSKKGKGKGKGGTKKVSREFP